MNAQLRKFGEDIEKCWSQETAYYPFLWRKNNNSKTSGQCLVTALLVQELFGGDILYTYVEGNEEFDHYWNRIKGEEVDFTKEQFEKGTKFVAPKVVVREDLLQDARTKETYELLKRNYTKLGNN